MGLFAWWRARRGADDGLAQWRREWAVAAAAADPAAAGRLRASLQHVDAIDLEIEEEMLEGLERLVVLTAELEAGRLPAVETTHRVVGRDTCYFSAPVSMPDDPAQPSGRLLLTSGRAVFIGGPRMTTMPWHATAQAIQGERDVVLVRADGQAACRFRCNSYGDALCAATIARHVIERQRTRGSAVVSDL